MGLRRGCCCEPRGPHHPGRRPPRYPPLGERGGRTVLAVESAPAAAGRRGIDVSPAGVATDSPGASEALRDGQATPEPELRQPGQSAEPPLRSAVVINPARVQDLPERRRLIESAIAAAGWPAPTWWETTPDDPGTGQARRAVELGAEVFSSAAATARCARPGRGWSAPTVPWPCCLPVPAICWR